MTAPDLRWQRRAACHGMAHLFFAPEVEKPGDREWREAQAKAICFGCPVRRACLAYRLGIGQQLDSGVWGGKDELERRQLRRNMLRAQRKREAA
jgi:WhiB family transcriptional regulator, redox-sensing transcriptional regulator